MNVYGITNIIKFAKIIDMQNVTINNQTIIRISQLSCDEYSYMFKRINECECSIQELFSNINGLCTAKLYIQTFTYTYGYIFHLDHNIYHDYNMIQKLYIDYKQNKQIIFKMVSVTFVNVSINETRNMRYIDIDKKYNNEIIHILGKLVNMI